MKKIKRVDLIFGERELDEMLKSLEKSKVPGYTVMKHVTGRGPERIVSEDMEFTGLGANAHVIVFCEDEVVERMKLYTIPLLNYYGGVAFFSEATTL